MNCGIPYCHGTGSVEPGTPGCPVNNQIPDWNDLVYTGNWEEAARNLHSTNNFPEVTGRVCPAPCEAACVLEIEEGNAVTIKQIELAIVTRAWEENWIVAEPPAARGLVDGRRAQSRELAVRAHSDDTTCGRTRWNASAKRMSAAPAPEARRA